MRNLSLRSVRRQATSAEVFEHAEDLVEWFGHPDDEDVVCLVLRDGDVREGEDVVGSVENGITCGAVSPDGEVLAVCSTSGTMIIMQTGGWEVAAEVTLPGVATCCAWRRDGEFLAVFCGDRDELLVFGRDGTETARNPDGFGDASAVASKVSCCSFGRSGGLIAAGLAETGEIRFFERNSLRHHRSDFQSAMQGLKSIGFNADGELLAILDGQGSFVRIYYRNNNHWYMKKELRCKGIEEVKWDAFRPMRLHLRLSNRTMESVDFTWKTDVSTDDKNTVGVVDGEKMLLTTLMTAVVPPPMCSKTVDLGKAVADIIFAFQSSKQFALLPDQSLVDVESGDTILLRGNAISEVEDTSSLLRMPCISQDGTSLIAASGDVEDPRVYVLKLDWEGRTADAEVIPLTCEVEALCFSSAEGSEWVWVATNDHNLSRLSNYETLVPVAEVSTEVIELRSGCLSDGKLLGEFVVAFLRCGKLVVVHAESTKAVVITDECTSFDVTQQFLVFTTRSNVMHVLSLVGDDSNKAPSLQSIIQNGAVDLSTENGRPIDRGSRIVSALFDELHVVLQAPRGNLETVCPRPMALKALSSIIREKDYASAFKLCRKQRLDANLLIHDGFDSRKFVADVPVPSRLSVFISSLSQQTLQRVDDDLLAALKEKQDVFLHAIVTLLMSFEIPRIGSALKAIADTADSSRQEDAMDYLLILTKDQEGVYTQALATYDLRLASMVVAHSQLDPKQYRDELQKLSEMPETRRNFEIAQRAGKLEEALNFMFDYAPKEDVLDFACDNRLHARAVELFREDALAVNTIRKSHASLCMEDKNFVEAANLFLRAECKLDAAAAFRESGDHLLAVSCAREALEGSDLSEFLESVVAKLDALGQAKASAHVLYDCLDATERAIEVLCSAGEWSAALELTGRKATDRAFTESIIVPQMIQGSDSRIGDLEEKTEKLVERGRRLKIVRELKASRPEREDDEGSDVYPESDAGSMVSNFTFASNSSQASQMSQTSRMSQASHISTTASLTIGSTSTKRERYAARKRAKVQKKKKRIVEGHPQEEEYIIEFLKGAIPTLDSIQDISNLIRAMVVVGQWDHAQLLQGACQEHLDAVCALPPEVIEGHEYVDDQSWKLKFL